METISLYAKGAGLSQEEVSQGLDRLLAAYPKIRRVLILPPDFTRYPSMAGMITRLLFYKLEPKVYVEILPATGTHRPMTEGERRKMFGDLPAERFLEHHWRTDTVRLGEIPAAEVGQISGGLFSESIAVEVNRRLTEGGYDLILSVGQVVPHEVAGMANYSKNIFVGVGGREMINKTHMLGAVCGLENALGRDHAPVRQVFDSAQERFLKNLPLVYLLTVIGREGPETSLQGLFMGDTREAFGQAVKLSQECNIRYEDRPAKKVVAYLDPEELQSTWVGNKAVYRLRMLVADGGELIILAPGVRSFGENPEVDAAIRTHGYRGTARVMEAYRAGAFENLLMAAAHLIHGSSEGRFTITYATDPKLLSREEVQSVGFRHMDLPEARKRYDPAALKNGWNTLPDGEEIYFVDAPALGLWKCRGK